jgi:ABC-2 type transport system permease protein
VIETIAVSAEPDKIPSPLLLLIRVNLLQSWRKIKSVRAQSRLLSSLIGFFVFGYLLLAFWMFRLGLRFLGAFPGLGQMLTERLMFLLFAFLLVLLLFSNLVISYTNFFRNRETNFLISLPISAQTVFRWKFLESVLLASWAFLFLIAPLLAAYGLSQHAAWHFYVVTIVLIAIFLVLPGVAGAWAAISLARLLDRRSFQILALTIAVSVLVAAAFWLKPEIISDELTETRVMALMDRLLARTLFSEYHLLPSYWLSYSVLQWSEGALAAASFFMLVLLSHVLFFGYLSMTRSGKSFYEAFSTVQSRATIFGRWAWAQNRRNNSKAFGYGQGMTEKFFGLLRNVSPDVRALLVKDARIFWRDTTQWGQTLVLFGLLGVYIINLRHFSQQLTNPFWVHLISYLNLGACALNLATLTTRFVYPQFSLEGKRLWIVGMAPLGMAKIVKAKFWLGSLAALVVTVSLMGLSSYMLKLPWLRTVYLSGIITIMTFTLTGLAIGMGALYPNFKEDNPSKIVSGFGGTFCLVLSFIYIAGSVTMLAIGSPWGWRGDVSLSLSVMTWIAFLALSALIGWAPFRLGLRRVAKFEVWKV